METAEATAVMPSTALRWFHLTPGRCLMVLLAVEAVLFLSEPFHWFPFNEQKGYTVLITIATVGVALLLMLLWFVVSLLFRWRFQFSIRSLLVLTVVVAIPCSWLAVEMKKATRQRTVVTQIREAGGGVVYECEYDQSGNRIPCVSPLGQAWLCELLGDDLFGNVWSVGFRHSVGSCLPKADDSVMEHVKELPELRFLHLVDTEVTDVGLQQVRALVRLQSLNLGYTQVTDAGLQHLAGAGQLQSLFLDDTQVTDEGLQYLKGLTHLKELYLCNTRVTDAGVERLQKALPNCNIHR